MAVHGISPDGRQLLGWSAVPVPFATVVVILRFICRRRTAGIGVDDWVMLCAVIFYYGLFAIIVAWAVLGKAGWHEADLSSDQLEWFLKFYFILRYVYAGAGGAAKISILFLYRRLFSVVSYIPWTTLIFGIFVVAWAVATSVAGMFQCLPPSSYWNVSGHRNCMNTRVLFIILAVTNMVIDFSMLLIPVPIIWNLRISVRHKLYLSATFMLGTLACVAGVLRIVFELAVNTNDVSGTAVASVICFSFEAGVGIVTGCLPTLGPLLVRWRPSSKDANGAGWRRVSVVRGDAQKDKECPTTPTSNHSPKTRSNSIHTTLDEK